LRAGSASRSNRTNAAQKGNAVSLIAEGLLPKGRPFKFALATNGSYPPMLLKKSTLQRGVRRPQNPPIASLRR
jgi:hypothetical protein